MASGQKITGYFHIRFNFKTTRQKFLNFRHLRKKGICIFLSKLFFFSGQAFSDGAHKFF